MRFRYKVLSANLILLSIALGILGYLLIHQNFNLALDNQKENALLQNNLIQSSVEYSILDAINSSNAESKLRADLPEIGARIYSGMMTTDQNFFIILNQDLLYQSNEHTPPEELFEDLELGNKQFLIKKVDGKELLYITSINVIQKTTLYVVTENDISSVYTLMHKQLNYFQAMLLIVLLFCSIIMFLVSRMLTKPLENLHTVSQSLSNGKYDTRAQETGQDEISELAKSFNQMAESIELHIEELNAMVKRKEQFVADFTHEMKTPMTSIIGYADTLRSKQLSHERIRMAANYIFTEGKRLEVMSRKLFDLIYLSQNEIALENVSTKQLIDEVNQSVTPMLTQKELQLVLDVENDFLLGDKDLLKTTFINLVDNARKASHEHSEIAITGKRIDDTTYEFRVIDHGIGMSEEVRNKVCDEFFMADKSRARQEGGAGLGMSLSAIILKRHHGHLTIESKEDVGTTMILHLQRYKGNQSRQTETER